MKRFVIEREVPGVGQMARTDPGAIATKSNAALAQLAPKVQWVQSYVTKDKTFCIYLAQDEDVIREHARLSGFPANKITEVLAIVDPVSKSL